MKTVHEPRTLLLKTKQNKTVNGGNLQRRGSMIQETELNREGDKMLISVTTY